MDNNKLFLKVGIFVFDGVEPTDFIGPYDVFTAVDFGHPKKQTTLYQTTHTMYDVFTVSETKKDIHVSAGGLVFKAKYDFSDCPAIDILVVPGGRITAALLSNSNVIDWLQNQSKNAEITFSVCSGALLLAKAGLLKESSATTHHLALDALLAIDPTITLKKDDRFIDNGRIITAAGVTAGYDAAMYIVAKTVGNDAFFKAGEILEYGEAWKIVQRRLAGLPAHRPITDKCIK